MRSARRILNASQMGFYCKLFGFKPVKAWQKEFLLCDSDIYGVDGARRTGKSEVASFRILTYAAHFVDKLPPDDYPQLSLVPEMEQHLTFTKLLTHLLRKPNPFHALFKVVRHPRPQLVSNVTGMPVVEWKSEGYDKGRSLEGHQYAAVFVDEASYVSEECVFTSVYPMLADYDGQMCVITKPYGGKGNWVYRLLYGDGDRPPCPRWSPNLLEHAPTETIAEWAAKQKPMMPEKAYRQEILGEWVEDAEAVFPEADIRDTMRDAACCLGHPKLSASYTAGIDVAVYTDYSAVVVVTKANGVIAVVDTLTFNKQELGAQAERIAAFLAKYPVTRVAVDCTHIGEGMPALLKAAMKKTDNTAQIVGHRFGNNKKEFVGYLQTLLARGMVKISPYSKELLKQLRGFSYTLSDAGTLRMQGKGCHDDLVMALALAVWNPMAARAAPLEPMKYEQFSHAWWQELARIQNR